MDIGLPDMTGIDAARAMNQNPSTSRLPIIAYSAWYTRSWKEKAANVGMAAYLVKTVPMALMKETIEKFILPYGAAGTLSLRPGIGLLVLFNHTCGPTLVRIKEASLYVVNVVAFINLKNV